MNIVKFLFRGFIKGWSRFEIHYNELIARNYTVGEFMRLYM